MGRKSTHKILGIRHLNKNVYVVRIERGNINFRAGQHIPIGFPMEDLLHDYSIYSGEKEPFIELLIKERANDEISVRLKHCQPNESVVPGEPEGEMVIQRPEEAEPKYLFIATGTGIGPFHSMVKSYAQLDYQIVHGISSLRDLIDIEDFDRERYTACVSRKPGGDFSGRVTEYIRLNQVNKDSLCYIAGFPEMVFEMYHLLLLKGIPKENLFTDVFFQ